MSAQSRKLLKRLHSLNGQCSACRTSLRFWRVIGMRPTCPTCGSHLYTLRNHMHVVGADSEVHDEQS